MLGNVSAWLREQRLARGWSMAEMGRQIQHAARTNGDHTLPGTAILASYVRRWEAGKVGLTERYRLHYCAALGIPPVQFGARRARALARLGRDDEAQEALDQARARLERAGYGEIGGLWSVIPARFHSLASNIQMWCGDPAQVLAETTQALELFETSDARDRNYGAESHTRIDQALAHLSLQDLDGADAALRPVLALSAENRYEPITQHLGQTQQSLAQPHFRNAVRAQQLQEEIEVYCQESLANSLTG